METKKLSQILANVREARRIIESGGYDEKTVTELCGKLGFSDTAFRDKTSEQKMGDFLLDEKYWIDRAFVVSNPDEHFNSTIVD